MSMTDEQCAIMRKTLEHILANRKEWKQLTWGFRKNDLSGSCQTAFCFAGHAAVTIAGASPVWEANAERDTSIMRWVTTPYASENVSTLRKVDYFACELMGLNIEEGYALFDANNNIRDLVGICYELSGSRVDLRYLLEDVD